MEKLHTVSKNKTRVDCGSDHELLIAKCRLKLKKVRKTTRPFSSVQSLSRIQLFVTPWITARQASLSNTNSQSSFKPSTIELVMQSSHLILCHPIFLLPPIPPSIRVFSNESTLHMKWPKYSRFSFSIIPSKEIPGLISFRMDWLDLLAVQGTLKSLLQHHSSKASILQRSEKKCKKQNCCLGRPYNSCEKKRSERQKRKGKMCQSECRVPKNSKET